MTGESVSVGCMYIESGPLLRPYQDKSWDPRKARKALYATTFELMCVAFVGSDSSCRADTQTNRNAHKNEGHRTPSRPFVRQ